jgi:hypothetical protein
MMSYALSGVIFLLMTSSTSVAIRQNVVNEALLANHQDIVETIHTMLKTEITAGAAMEAISGKILKLEEALITDGQFIMVRNYHEFAGHYLWEYDLPENERASKQTWLEKGKYTGMTGPSGKIYVKETKYSRHDVVHEIVHLLHGGPNNQLEKNEGLDECFTEYYAKKLCQLLGIPDSPVAYPDNVDFMRRLETLLQTELGAEEKERVLFETFWKRHGDENNENNVVYRIDVLAEAIAKRQIEKARRTHWDTNPLYYKNGHINTYKNKMKKWPEKLAKWEKKAKKTKR